MQSVAVHYRAATRVYVHQGCLKTVENRDLQLARRLAYRMPNLNAVC